ncbi:hypothetical protein ACFL5H_04210, partial [Candidatus Latescibacterota bacterium]
QLRENLTRNGLNVDSFDVLIGQNNQTGTGAGMDSFRERAEHASLRRGPGFSENMRQVELELHNGSGPAQEISHYSRFFDRWI